MKATPLVLIAVGLSLCYLANVWNIGAEGQFLIGAVAGSWLAVVTHGTDAGYWVLPAMLVLGALGGALYALIPAICKVRFGASEILTSLMLVYVADLLLDYLVRGPWRDPQGLQLPDHRRVRSGRHDADPDRGQPPALGAIIALVVVMLAPRSCSAAPSRASRSAGRRRAARGALCRLQRRTAGRSFTFAISGALAGLAGIIEVAGPIGHLQPGISPGYGFTAIIVAFLGRLNPIGILIAGLFLALTFIGGESAQISLKVPLDLTKVFQGILLFYVLACDSLILYRIRLVTPSRRGRRMGLLEAILLTVITASTPLLLAASGELVVERAGVLNLGVEGMMIIGAACGFAGAYLTGSTAGRRALRHSCRRRAWRRSSASLTLGLAVNQVATGLALTILGVGLSGPDRRRLRRRARSCRRRTLYMPYLTDIPFVGRILFGAGCLRLSLGRAGRRHLAGSSTAPAPGWCCARSATTTPRRTRSAIRCCASACWRCCSAAPAPASAAPILSLAYTPFFIPGMTAGRGWIALALVVFASWLPRRLVVGAYLFGAVTILQLHAQGAGLGIPSQLMSSLPYLATIIVLVVISRTRGTAGSAAPASLGSGRSCPIARSVRSAARCDGRRVATDMRYRPSESE